VALLEVDVGFPSERGHDLNSDYPSIFAKMRTLSGPPPAESWSGMAGDAKTVVRYPVSRSITVRQDKPGASSG